MKQVFFHYKDWECWKNGMYSTSKNGFEEMVNKSVELFKNKNILLKKMTEVSEIWVNSTAENFTNQNVNPRPWLGRAVCCYNHKATEDAVRVAWMKLTKKEMDFANNAADVVIKRWIEKRKMNGYEQLKMFEE